MRARLRHARISPKKANLIAGMVRGMPAEEALAVLGKLPKKGARILHGVLSSALANAEHSASQDRNSLLIRSLVVTKGREFRRYIPMARGRARPIDKETAHITVELGIDIPVEKKGAGVKTAKNAKSKKNENKEGKAKPQGKEDKEKSDDDIIYSESKPVVDAPGPAKGNTPRDDATPGSAPGSDAGSSATFQGQRKGGRGS